MRRTHQSVARATSNTIFFFIPSLSGHTNTGKWKDYESRSFHDRKGNLPYRPFWRIKEMVNVSKEGQVYECEICGNVVVIKVVGGGELVCCGEPMKLIEG